MKKTIFAAFVSLLIFTGGTNAFAVHKKLTNEDQKHLAITIYNNNIALVKDRRSVHLKKGINRLSFSDISAKIIPNSALIRRESPKPSFKVIEQAFRYEQLTPKSLLEASVGQEVFIDLGHEPIQSGRLVSVHGGILVSIKGKMREVKEHQLLFPQVPHELATNPELTLKLECSETAAASMELSYLTTGLSWEASYIGEISADGSTIDLGSWVTLTNTTSSDYSDANLQLVAADVTWGASFHGKGQEKGIPHAFEAIRLLGFPMYGLSHRVSLRGHEVKQVSLLSLQQVKLTREFLVQGTKEYLFKDMTGRALPAQVETWLSFSNTEEIGAPLPKGIIRLYKRDPKGHVQFVGEDFIDHTLPKGK
ncbi:MAG: hypothetical protein HOI80_01840, partial [Alphaproteobacteria bacterium]|nr:hypothetical protein [Alphaproteobacteria bacterium]